MKTKIFIFLALFLVTLFSAGLSNQAKGSDVTSESSTTTIQESTAQTTKSQDYMEYVNSVYNEIYDDVYTEVHDDLYAMIEDELYTDIEQNIENRFSDLLSNDTFYVDAEELQKKIYAVKDLADQSVVGVVSYGQEQNNALGSSIVYRYDETENRFWLLTNYHVIEDGDHFEVTLSDETIVEADLHGYNSTIDIAVLSFSAKGIDDLVTVSTLGTSSSSSQGDLVFAVGNSEGYNFFNSFTMGILSGKNRKIEEGDNRYLQHDAAINSGNSGGPLYNIDGTVIGINVSKFVGSEIEGMGFAIPIENVTAILEDLENGLRT